MLLALLLMVPAALAQQLEARPLPQIYYSNLIKPLMEEIKTLTRLPLPRSQPRVFLADRRAIEQIYCPQQLHDCHVAAITDDKTGDIILSPELLQINVYTASVVFHELVHWAQVKNHLFAQDRGCVHWARSEQHAYTAQSRFLELHGARPLTVPDLMAQCR